LQTDGRWCRKRIGCVGFPAICGSSQSKPGVAAPGFLMILTLNYTNKKKDLIIFFELNGIKSHNIIKPAA